MKHPPPQPRITVPKVLPDDPQTLKALIARLVERTDALEMKSLRLEMELLKHKKWMYGPRADRLASLNDVAQMLLGFGEELDARPMPDAGDAAALAAEDKAADQSAAAAEAPPSRRVRRGRRDLGSDAVCWRCERRWRRELCRHHGGTRELGPVMWCGAVGRLTAALLREPPGHAPARLNIKKPSSAPPGRWVCGATDHGFRPPPGGGELHPRQASGAPLGRTGEGRNQVD